MTEHEIPGHTGPIPPDGHKHDGLELHFHDARPDHGGVAREGTRQAAHDWLAERRAAEDQARRKAAEAAQEQAVRPVYVVAVGHDLTQDDAARIQHAVSLALSAKPRQALAMLPAPRIGYYGVYSPRFPSGPGKISTHEHSNLIAALEDFAAEIEGGSDYATIEYLKDRSMPGDAAQSPSMPGP